MAAPFIFIGTHQVKPGKLEEFKAWFANYIDTTVEPNEPRLLSFEAYADPKSRYQIYGTPQAGVLELIQQMDGSEEAPTSQEPFAGFTRLGKGAVAA